MIELVILDLVLLLGIAVVPRHASRSFLAVRRIAKEGLREVTARERVAAPAAVWAFVGRTGRAARGVVTGPGARPALLPSAAALIAVVGIAGYAAWTGPEGAELPAEAAASEAGVLYHPFGHEGDAGDVATPAPGTEVACEGTLRLRDAVIRSVRTTRAAAGLSAGIRGTVRVESLDAAAEALEAARALTAGVRIRIL